MAQAALWPDMSIAPATSGMALHRQIAAAREAVMQSIEELEPIIAGGFKITKLGTWSGSAVN
jgi:hypothetical protein